MDKRAILVQAAYEVMSTKGYAELSLRDIARTAGVSLSSIHYHFANKEALLLEVVKTFKEAFIGEMQKIGSSYSRNKIHDLIEYLTYSVTNRGPMHRLWYDLQVIGLYNDEFRKEVQYISEQFLQLTRQVLQETVGRRMSEAELQIHSSIIFSAIDGSILQIVMSKDAQEIKERFVMLEHFVNESIGVQPTKGREGQEWVN